jgi:hypothetical protein
MHGHAPLQRGSWESGRGHAAGVSCTLVRKMCLWPSHKLAHHRSLRHHTLFRRIAAMLLALATVAVGALAAVSPFNATPEFSVGYGKSSSSVTMVNSQDGFCFLTDVNGQLVQSGDSCSVVMSTQGPDSEWMLTRNGQTAPVGCSARCALWNSTGFPPIQ